MRSIDPNTVATPSESRAEVLRLTGRNYGVVRHVLVQHPRGSSVCPSTLGTLVHTRKHRALLLYLLLLVGGHEKLPGDGHEAARWRS